MSEVLVIGHRNPDTDAICSAIGYAEFKRRTGLTQAIAARCGDTNERIDFVLKTFGVPPPRFVADVSPKVCDVMQPDVISLPPDATVASALSLMDERGIRVLPILNPDRTCGGLLSLFKMSQYFFPKVNRLFDSRRVLASLTNLALTLDAQMVLATEAGREEDLILMIGAMSLEAFGQRLSQFDRGKLVVVVGNRQDIQVRAVQERVRVIIVTGGLPIEEPIIEAAQRRSVSLLISPHDTATTAMLCRAAITVKHMTHEQFLTFNEGDPLVQAKSQAAHSPFHAFPVLGERNQMAGIVVKSDFLKKVERQLILVDHNELSQAVHGADQVEILEVIDHHRIGNLTTHQPILFRNEPVGSTCTIVADCFFRAGVEMPPAIAGLLLAGLVSDTLNLTSPTTTERDAAILRQLEQRADLNATAFTEKLFASGSLLTSRSASQAITADCKEYVEKGRTFSVAQIEEIEFVQFWKRKPEIVAALEAARAANGYDFAALLVTDVVQQTSLLVIAGEPALLQHIDYPQLEPGLYELNQVVSRKKQVLPYLTHCLEKMP